MTNFERLTTLPGISREQAWLAERLGTLRVKVRLLPENTVESPQISGMSL